MLLQLGAVFSSLLGQVGEAAIGFGSQFLNKELNRGNRRRERDFLKLKAAATGAGQPAFTGPVSQPFGAVFGGGVPVLSSTFPLNPLDFRDPVRELREGITQFASTNNGFSGTIGPTRTLSERGGTGRRRFTRTRDNCNVQHFRFDGKQMRPIEQIPMIKGPRFRFDQEKQDFVPVPRRRMNPANFRATNRALTRVDRSRDFCKRLFREVRKQKSGTVQVVKKKKKK